MLFYALWGARKWVLLISTHMHACMCLWNCYIVFIWVMIKVWLTVDKKIKKDTNKSVTTKAEVRLTKPCSENKWKKKREIINETQNACSYGSSAKSKLLLKCDEKSKNGNKNTHTHERVQVLDWSARGVSGKQWQTCWSCCIERKKVQ